MRPQTTLVIVGLAVGIATAVAASSDYETEAMATHKQMMESMQMKPSGEPDKDFAAMMIPHHQGAIDMARLELKYGKEPALLAMAEKIIGAQEKEMEQLKAWQAKAK
jgi:uncharacterized protein (DUF305 family)